MFTVDGRPEWDMIHDISLETNYVTIDDDPKIARTIGDIDGDAVNDELYFQGIRLSTTGQFIAFGYSEVLWSFNMAAWPTIY
jgi:hypothetical protein